MKNLLIPILIATASASIFAADNSNKPFIAIDIGKAKYSNVEIDDGIKFDDPGAIKIAAGYRFTKNIATEIGYTYFGDSTLEFYTGSTKYSATLAMRSINAALIASLPITEKFEVSGKFGYSKNQAKLTDSAGFSVKENNGSAFFGLGAQYNFSPKFALRAQYENYGEFTEGTEPPKASVISLGTVFTF